MGGALAVALPGTLILLGYSDEVVALTAIIAVAALTMSVSELLPPHSRGLQWIGLNAALGVVGRTVISSIVLLLVFLGRPVTELVAVDIPVLTLIATIGTLALLRRRGYGLERPDAPTVRAIVTGSLPFVLGGAAMVVYGQINTLLLGWLAIPDWLAGMASACAYSARPYSSQLPC